MVTAAPSGVTWKDSNANTLCVCSVCVYMLTYCIFLHMCVFICERGRRFFVCVNVCVYLCERQPLPCVFFSVHVLLCVCMRVCV